MRRLAVLRCCSCLHCRDKRDARECREASARAAAETGKAAAEAEKTAAQAAQAAAHNGVTQAESAQSELKLKLHWLSPRVREPLPRVQGLQLSEQRMLPSLLRLSAGRPP